LQVRPPAPIAWKANGATTLVNGGFSKYELGGSLANPPDDPEGVGKHPLVQSNIMTCLCGACLGK
jgi:hypothetical protein